MVEKRDPTGFLRQEYEELVKNSLDWKLRSLESGSQAWSIVDGKKVLMMCSNNYLGLSMHPKVIDAAIEATKKYGAGSGSVRPIAGNMSLHIDLEKKIARFKHADAALVYMSGFAANQGLIPQLVGKGDIIVSDELNHGSIIDGVRLSRADKTIYKHCDMSDLEKVVKEADKTYRRILIVTDGVFSMDGDIAPMDEIVKIADEYGAMTYVDDAHGEGVLGDGGRGIVSHFNLEGKVHIEMGTFSKAFGVVGGYVAGTDDLRLFALNKSRSWLLSGTHNPATTAACIAAIDILETEPQHVEKLWENTQYFKKELQSLGFDTGKSTTPITPVMCGESKIAKDLSEKLWELNVFGFPIVYPMVARDKARIRTIVRADFTRDDLDYALNAFEKSGKEVGLI